MKHILPLLAALVMGSLNAADKPVIAVYDLEGVLSEGGQQQASLLGFSMSSGRPLTHFDLVRSLRQAGEDAQVKGVVLEIDQASLGVAQLQDIRRRLLAIRDAGKDVWIYTDGLTLRTALLGSAANHFVLMPEGDVSLTGL